MLGASFQYMMLKYRTFYAKIGFPRTSTFKNQEPAVELGIMAHASIPTLRQGQDGPGQSDFSLVYIVISGQPQLHRKTVSQGFSPVYSASETSCSMGSIPKSTSAPQPLLSPRLALFSTDNTFQNHQLYFPTKPSYSAAPGLGCLHLHSLACPYLGHL